MESGVYDLRCSDGSCHNLKAIFQAYYKVIASIHINMSALLLEKLIVHAPHEQVVYLMTSLIQRSIPSSDCQQNLIVRMQDLYQLTMESGCLQHPGQCGLYLLMDFWFELLWHFSSQGQPPQSIVHKLQSACNETLSKPHLLEVLQYRCDHPTSACFNFIGRAIFFGDVATMQLLLQYGVDPNFVEEGIRTDGNRNRYKLPCFDGTPLAYILSIGCFLHPTMTMAKRFEMLQVLLLHSKHRVDVNALHCKSKSMATPLHDVATLWFYAVNDGKMPDRKIYQDVADFLVTNGANPDVHRTTTVTQASNLRGQPTDTARKWCSEQGFDISRWSQTSATAGTWRRAVHTTSKPQF